MKILILYGDYKDVNVGDIFPKDSKITKIPIWKYMMKPGDYKDLDAVLSVQSLQKVEAIDVPVAIENFHASLKMGGEVYIYVPALEWAAQQFFSTAPSLILNVVLYGPKTMPNRTGFTLSWLRLLVETKFRLAQASQGKFEIQLKNDKEEISKYQFLQNIVIGQKLERKDAPKLDASTALD